MWQRARENDKDFRPSLHMEEPVVIIRLCVSSACSKCDVLSGNKIQRLLLKQYAKFLTQA